VETGCRPSGYIFTWLVGYSALLGPIGGIMIADYYVLRRRQLISPDSIGQISEYRYTNGFQLDRDLALVVAVLPNLPGFSCDRESCRSNERAGVFRSTL